MASNELIFEFSEPAPDSDTFLVNVSFDGTDSGAFPFQSPITDKDREDIRWYVETYGAHSLADPDDKDALRIEHRLPEIGQALFKAVLSQMETYGRYLDFRRSRETDRVITIRSSQASILSLPWELLRDPTGEYLLREKPHISVRRTISGSTKGRAPFKVEPKETIHLLFVVSRPSDAGFIDPRTDPRAVLDALDEYAPGRVTYEFLRPATLNALTKRLSDDTKPAIDILHFDGHGVFQQITQEELDKNKGLYSKSIESELQRASRDDGQPGQPIGIGFLVFENEEGKKQLISANDLGENLFQSQVGLVVLSACQTATLDAAGDPMASVAGRLTATGTPAILAMTHSVLVVTTKMLFGKFYESLAQGRSIARSLDEARVYLANNPEKFEVRRGHQREKLKLYDWFVPALFHSGNSSAMLTKSTAPPAERPALRHNFRKSARAGFFGRRRELWDIECWFAGQARRISITGFGGQGKTELALEAGRWLLRTGMFQQAVFVDYASVQSIDPVAVAVSTIGAALGQTLIDAEAVSCALRESATLIILDNLESLDDEPLQQLLITASKWSQTGRTRVLLTSRKPETGHPDYAIEGTFEHRRIQLTGLGSASNPDDALDWYRELDRLPTAEPRQIPPPERADLIQLFDRVRFHPLSICVLVQLLKSRTAKELDRRLEQLLAPGARSLVAEQGTPDSLLASLELSLERLSDQERHAVRRLGVFQGGAFEDDLLAITQLDNLWPGLRRSLEAAALIEAESIPGVGPPFLRFHPTLAPLLWSELTAEEQQSLTLAHRQRYYADSGYLYQQDRKNPHQVRAIVRRELPNLLHAVHIALDAGDPNAVEFVDRLNRFLNAFGMKHEAALLTRRAGIASGERGSASWYLAQSNQGEQMLASGQVGAASKIFLDILDSLGESPSYERAVTLAHIGRCYAPGGRPDLAEDYHREAIAVAEKLDENDQIKLLRSTHYLDLANVLADQGKYAEARTHYELSLEINRELSDLRGQGVALAQLGSLALQEGNLSEALNRYQDALTLFQRLGEPASEARVQHQLGIVFQYATQWEQAEFHYREAARLREELGDLTAAAQTWNQLATVALFSGKPRAAEAWFRKAIDGGRKSQDYLPLSRALSNLAQLLRQQPERLDEARKLAEEALEIDLTLDPGAAQIWKTYSILADIADQQCRPSEAINYRRQAREAKRNFAGTRHELKRRLSVIIGVLQAISRPETIGPFRTALAAMGSKGWGNLVAAIEKILNGERHADALCEPLDLEDSMIIEAILAAIENPDTLNDLLPSEEPGEPA